MDPLSVLRYPGVMTEIDAIGLRCPLPVLRLRRALRDAARVRLLADDAMAQIDVPHFCAEAGHVLLEARQQGDVYIFTVARGLSEDRGAC